MFHMYVGRVQIFGKRTNNSVFTSRSNFTVKLMEGGGFDVVGCQILLYSNQEHWTVFLQPIKLLVGKIYPLEACFQVLLG